MIRAELQDGIAVLTLDRAAKRNALTPDMLRLLRERAADAARGARAVLVTGDGPVFCAGFDLQMCDDAPDGSVMRALLSGLSETIGALRDLAVPVIAAAHGAAIAGGCALLGGADVVVADRDARLGYPVVKIGVSPAVSAPFLRLSVGDGGARTRMLDPALWSGAEAARIGLVHELVERPEDVLPRAVEAARRLGEKPAGAMAATKAWLRDLEGVGDWAGRALGASMALAGGEEERSRLAAMLQG